MASSKAQLAKDKGNTAFKLGDFLTAIEHYTDAIFTDPLDATFPLNRAAAYLKLGKNEDAERDCTTVITLNATNVKALFRRAQARLALAKLVNAQADLTEALRLEPGNQAVKQEMKKIEDLLKDSGKRRKKFDLAASTTRRRIPIEIVEPTAGSSSEKQTAKMIPEANMLKIRANESDFMKPLASRSLASEPRADNQNTPASAVPSFTATQETEYTPVASKPNTFQDAKKVRESAKPSRAGGGIFRSSGEHTVVGGDGQLSSGPPKVNTTDLTQKATNGSSNATATKAAKSNKLPLSLFDFTKSWESLTLPEERWDLFHRVPPASLAYLFQNSLEASMLASILSTFEYRLKRMNESDDVDKGRLREYMFSFTKVPRFSTVVLFMSKAERELAKSIWEKLGIRNGGASWGLK